MKLDKKDRLILINQYKILEKLYPDDMNMYKNHRIALEDGFELNYNWLFEELDEELSEEKCKEIFAILSMFRAIYNSSKNIPKEELNNLKALKFQGVNVEYEYKEFAYINYIINELDRFEELKYGNKLTDFNSRVPMLEKYKHMLDFWKKNSSPQEMDLPFLIKLAHSCEEL